MICDFCKICDFFVCFVFISVCFMLISIYVIR